MNGGDGGIESARRATLRLLAGRARTQAEVEGYLRRLGFAEEVVREAVDWAHARGYLDDLGFCRSWIDSRQALRPSGRRLLQYELSRRGVDSRTIEQALETRLQEESEEEAAARVAAAARPRLAGLEPAAALRRLLGLLVRRGFPPALARRTARRALQEWGLRPSEGLERELADPED